MEDPAESKPLCPCCHTHSRLVLERTLHDGFTSTVLCCSRHAIDPSSPSVWSPSCMCSPDISSLEGADPCLPEATLELSGCLELDEVGTDLKCAAAPSDRSQTEDSTGLVLLPEELGNAPIDRRDRTTFCEELQKYPTVPELNDESVSLGALQFTRKGNTQGVAYMRLPSNEAQSKAKEQQKRACKHTRGSQKKRDVWRSAVPITDVVIKIIHKDLMEKHAMQKAYDEVELLEELDHPNVMALLSSVNTEKELWLFFEHAEVNDLHKFTQHQTIPEEQIREICRQLLPALEYIHQKRIVHGDIKPQNVLLSLRHDVSDEVRARLTAAANQPAFRIPPSPAELIRAKKAGREGECQNTGKPGWNDRGKCLCSSAWHESCLAREGRCSEKASNESEEARSILVKPSLKDISFKDLHLRICDFGMAQRLNEEGIIEWTCVKGTHGYMAPEILNSINYDEKVDMWAFGSLLCRMATGQEPFYPGSACRLNDFSFHPCLWRNRSEGIKDLVSNLLCRDPKARFSAGEAMAHPWMTDVES